MQTVLISGTGNSRLMDVDMENLKLTIDRREGKGPSSLQLLLLSLGACTYGTVAHYMERKSLPIDSLQVELSGERAESGLYEKLFVKVFIDGQIPEKQCPIISNVAKSCRIHKTLHLAPEIDLDVVQRESAPG